MGSFKGIVEEGPHSATGTNKALQPSSMGSCSRRSGFLVDRALLLSGPLTGILQENHFEGGGGSICGIFHGGATKVVPFWGSFRGLHRVLQGGHSGRIL